MNLETISPTNIDIHSENTERRKSFNSFDDIILEEAEHGSRSSVDVNEKGGADNGAENDTNERKNKKLKVVVIR